MSGDGQTADRKTKDELLRIDELCDRFEDEWRAGRRPDLSAFADVPGPNRHTLLQELIRLDIEYRRRTGERPTRAEYAERFPELADRVPAFPAPDGTSTEGTVSFAHGATSDTDAGVFGYRILNELGGGGQGIVYRALQIGLNREVALKRIRAGVAARAGTLTRFWTEAESLGRLRHPNIVQVYDFGREGGEPYLCMELLTGGSLAERLERGPLPPPTAAELVRTLALAVQAAHEAGIVHRDLKPSNILFDGAGVPKLADFGLAKVLDAGCSRSPTEEGTILGTVAYMAPEQAAGLVVTGQADVHALGMVLYEALTGTRPFGGSRVNEILSAVIHHEAKPPSSAAPGCPRDLDLVCLRCLQKAPAGRYPTARALADDLQRWLRGEPVTAPGPAQRLRQWAFQRPVLTANLCALGALYTVHLVCHSVPLGPADPGDRFHTAATAVAGLWAAGSVLFQWLLDKPRWAIVRTYGWITMQVALVTALLWAGRGPASALVVGYPLLVVGSALSPGNSRMVWYSAALAALGYGATALGAWGLQPGERVPSSVVLTFVAMLLLLALIQSLLLRGAGRQ